MLPISFLTTSLALAATSVSALSLPLLPRQQSNNTTSSEFGWPTAIEALVRPNYFDGVVTMETLAGQQKFGAVDYCREVNLVRRPAWSVSRDGLALTASHSVRRPAIGSSPVNH